MSVVLPIAIVAIFLVGAVNAFFANYIIGVSMIIFAIVLLIVRLINRVEMIKND